MTKVPRYWSKAKKYLSKKDKKMSKLIKNYQSPTETILTTRRDIFFSICKSIIGQQISVAAANSVFLKFKKKCKNKINAKTVSKLTFNQLKSCGLSRQKVLGIRSLAKKILDKSFNPKLISRMNDDEAIIYSLTAKQIREQYQHAIDNIYKMIKDGVSDADYVVPNGIAKGTTSLIELSRLHNMHNIIIALFATGNTKPSQSTFSNKQSALINLCK